MARPLGPDGKPLSVDDFRKRLRDEATLILRAQRARVPTYGLRSRRTRRGRRPPVVLADEGMTCIYVIGELGAPVKIGITQDVEKRLRALQTGHPHQLRILATVQVATRLARDAERSCHIALKAERLQGEWFRVEAHRAVELIREVAVTFNRLAGHPVGTVA